MLTAIARLNIGGPAYNVTLLSSRVDPSRYETLLVAGHVGKGEMSCADLPVAAGVRMSFIPTMGPAIRPLHDAVAIGRLVRLMRQYRPDLVHTHTAKAGFLGRLAALTLRPRPVIVHTFHGHVLEGYFGRVKATTFRLLERALASQTDRLVAVSQATVDDLVRLGVAPRSRFRVIRVGLDLDRFLAVDRDQSLGVRRELGVGDHELLLLYAGRLVPIKRLDRMLRAFAAADPERGALRLAIIGDGELRGELERLAGELGVAERVAFLGYRRDLAVINAAGDLAVLTSDNEGTPVALIEAAAAGLPAVATAVGGVLDVVTPATGRVCPPDDHRLAAAIRELAADAELRRAMGERAREHVYERFSMARMVRDTEDLYYELLGKK